MKNVLKYAFMSVALCLSVAGKAYAQDDVAMPDFAAAAAPAAAADQPVTTALEESPDAKKGASKSKNSTGLLAVVFGSGWLGVVLWLCLFGSGIAAIFFVVDCVILMKEDKMIPKSLVSSVSQAMSEGDVMKALDVCAKEPGPLANILSSGFQHVEEGFEVIQEAISTAADIENERLSQRINWISVCGNISPSLGLLGTVQGMIMAFEGLATGSPDVGALALAISQALWTTAGGLVVSIPSVCAFYVIRNNAAKLVLRMSALTFELIKDLRHVEVVE